MRNHFGHVFSFIQKDCRISDPAADLKEGIYCQFKGPNYESPAEVRAAKILGASAVGMSTGCEAIAANHMGMQICGISCVTNMAAGM